MILQPRAAVGIYSTNAGVERTFIEFKLCGFDVEDISVVLSSSHSRTAVPGGANDLTFAAAALGTLHWLIGLGAAALQTSDSIIAAGPIAAVMEDTGADGRAAELSTALINFGIGEREASYCERRVRDGGSLVSVRPSSVRPSGPEWTRLATRLLEKTGAEQVWSTDEFLAGDTSPANQSVLLARSVAFLHAGKDNDDSGKERMGSFKG